jgi:hypothetical protein
MRKNILGSHSVSFGTHPHKLYKRDSPRTMEAHSLRIVNVIVSPQLQLLLLPRDGHFLQSYCHPPVWLPD